MTWSDFVNHAANFSAGWGDLVSFGLTAKIRELADIGSVDRGSTAYTAGEIFGFANVVLIGYAGGTRAAARASSPTNHSHFSHSAFPHRFLRRFDNSFAKWLDKTGNRLNGDYVSPQLHTRMDPAIFGRSAEWMRANPLFSPVRHWINRLPYMPGSVLFGTGSAGMNCNGEDCVSEIGMQTSFANSVKIFFGFHVFLPFEKALLDALAAAMNETDREILEEQLSKINMSRRLLRHVDEPKAYGYTNFYTVRWGKDITEREHQKRFRVTQSEGMLARCRVEFDGGTIDVEFWQVSGVLFGMRYRSPERIYNPPSPYRIYDMKVMS